MAPMNQEAIPALSTYSNKTCTVAQVYGSLGTNEEVRSCTKVTNYKLVKTSAATSYKSDCHLMSEIEDKKGPPQGSGYYTSEVCWVLQPLEESQDYNAIQDDNCDNKACFGKVRILYEQQVCRTMRNSDDSEDATQTCTLTTEHPFDPEVAPQTSTSVRACSLNSVPDKTCYAAVSAAREFQPL